MELEQEHIEVLTLHNKGLSCADISAKLNIPQLIVEQYIEEQDRIEPEEKLMTVINLSECVDRHRIQTNLVTAADWIVKETLINADNEFILNKLGKISVILKNANELIASNADVGSKKESKYGRFFKP